MLSLRYGFNKLSYYLSVGFYGAVREGMFATAVYFGDSRLVYDLEGVVWGDASAGKDGDSACRPFD
jgi:hypothetical protein